MKPVTRCAVSQTSLKLAPLVSAFVKSAPSPVGDVGMRKGLFPPPATWMWGWILGGENNYLQNTSSILHSVF